jgi:hypothetical protein
MSMLFLLFSMAKSPDLIRILRTCFLYSKTYSEIALSITQLSCSRDGSKAQELKEKEETTKLLSKVKKIQLIWSLEIWDSIL